MIMSLSDVDYAVAYMLEATQAPVYKEMVDECLRVDRSIADL